MKLTITFFMFSFPKEEKVILYPNIPRAWFEHENMERLLNQKLKENIDIAVNGGKDTIVMVDKNDVYDIIDQLMNMGFNTTPQKNYEYKLYNSNTIDFNCETISIEQWSTIN